MALHDAASTGSAATATAYREVCEPDKCHKLAWLLDACVKARVFVCVLVRMHALIALAPALQDGYCDQRRLKEIVGHLETLEKAVSAPGPSKQRLAVKLGRRAGADSEISDGGEGTCRPEETALTNLADAGMILRDPTVLHMLLHETVRTAGSCMPA